ncbi:hypothetical protein [Salinibacterium sp. TMP30]|uniref:hypothetical protein n=1 Tax=Salinibacterium sp. TMP30 TaxID=3138237 RepID=UPI0031391973
MNTLVQIDIVVGILELGTSVYSISYVAGWSAAEPDAIRSAATENPYDLAADTDAKPDGPLSPSLSPADINTSDGAHARDLVYTDRFPAVLLETFLSVWPVIVVRFVPLVAGFRGISSLRSGIPRPFTAGTLALNRFSCQTGKKIS